MVINNKGKGCGRKRAWPNLQCNERICLAGLKKTTNELKRVSVAGQGSNRAPLEYKSAQQQALDTF
jgi:hypothetical protein